MVKKMLERMVRKFNPVRIGQKVGKLGIDPFEARFYLGGTGTRSLAGKKRQYVSPLHRAGFTLILKNA